MEIMTISSLAGLGAVPGTVRTYGDALVYLVDGPGPTLNSAVLDAQDRLSAAAGTGKIGQQVSSSLINTAVQLQQRIGALYSAFAAQGHGLVLAPDDAASLVALESQATAFTGSVSSAIVGLSWKGWLGIGLGVVGAAGLIVWATRRLPTYRRRRRR